MANKNIKGITIEIGGNTTKLGKAIEDSEKKSRSLQIELRQVERLLKFDPTNLELLSQKQQILTQNIQETSNKLDTLKNAQEQVNEQYKRGEIGEEQLRAFQREILKTENDLNSMQKELEETNDSIKKIGQNDGFKNNSKDIEKAKKDLKELGDSVKENLDKVATGAKVIGTAVGAGMGYALKVSTDFDKALNTLATRTGATKEEMDALDESMQNVYKNNFGESIEDVAQSMATVKVNTKLMGEELEQATEYALLMRDTFEFDVNESTRTAKMLMDTFGISAKEAYNLIAQGAQNGLDKNGDLLDTLNEYSVHYKNLGFTSEEFFNSLVNGAQNGTFSVDKLGDATKEFGIRVKDTANTTNEGFQLIGLNADTMRKKFAQGGETAKKATQETITALFGLNDEVKRNQAGVDLFGTMWEDLGEDAIKSLMNVNGSISRTSKALDSINEQKYDDIGSQLKELGRTIETDVVKPLGKELQPIVKDAISYVKENAPQIRELIMNIADATGTMVRWLVDNSEIVLATITGIGAGFLAWKSYTIITTIVNSLQAFKTAQESATVAQLAFNTAVNANPIMLMVTVIGGLIGSLGMLSMAIHGATTEEEKQSQTIKENLKAMEERKQKQKETIEQGTAEITHLQNLNTELKTLVDKNGKVKKGYEDRVQFIIDQLNPALGTEMELVKGQIKGYKDVSKSIDEMLLKKKAEIILEAQLPSYKEAITNSTNAQIKATKLYNEYLETEARNNKQIKGLREQLVDASESETRAIMNKISQLENETKEKKKNYDDQNKIVKGFYSDIAQYEANSQKMSEGTQKAYNEILQSQVLGKAKNNDEKKILLQQELEAEKDYLKYLEDIYKTTGDKSYLHLIEGQKSLIKETEKNLKAVTSTVEQNEEPYVEAWAIMNDFAIQGIKKVSPNFKQAGIDNADQYNNGTSSQNEKAKKAGETIAENDKDGKASTKSKHEQAGKDNTQSYIDGGLSIVQKAQQAGEQIAQQSKEGEVSKKDAHRQAGIDNAKAYNSGTTSQGASAKTAGTNLSKQASSGLSSYLNIFKTTGVNLANNVIGGLNSKQNGTQTAGRNLANKGLSGYTGMNKSFINAGKETVSGIESGVNERKGILWTTMSKLGLSMLSSFKKSLDIKSPSRKFKRAGMDSMDGLYDGVDENADKVTERMDELGIDMLHSVDGLQLDKTINASLALDGMNTNIVSSQSYLANRVNVLISLINDYLPTIAEKAGKNLYINGRRLSEELASDMNIALGEIADFNERGG